MTEVTKVSSVLGMNRLMLEQMVSSINLAHQANPNSWRLEEVKESWILAVGFLKVLEIGSPNELVADESVLTESELNALAKIRDNGFGHKSRPWAGRYFLDADNFSETLKALMLAHESAVRRSAIAVVDRVQRWEYHREDMLHAIGQVLNVDLPSPSYARYLPTWNSPKFAPIEEVSAVHEISSLGTLDLITRQLRMAGLSYSSDQIATFYTALQTKGFVVPSGISGTGKSKIAQGFVRLLSDGRAIPLTVQPGFASNGGLTVPREFASDLGFPKENSSGPIMVSLASAQSEGLVRVRNNYGDNLFTEVRPKDKVRTSIAGMNPGTTLYAKFSHWQDGLPTKVSLEESTPSNSLFIAVRPDWRDSTSLLGYYNPLTETYEWTEFLRFLLRAAESYKNRDGLAWFVILDEMNLAHVEYYFADLLSIIESGRDTDGWSLELIRLTYPDAKTDNPPPDEIRLPPNLYIIGTVNMDETTHAFSPKVLDRAFTIELTDVDFSAYPPKPADGTAEMTEVERRSLLHQFSNGGKFARIDKGEIAAIVDKYTEIRTWLQNLNVRLAQFQFHFGYRVFDEIAQFIYHADRNGMFDDWVSAFDHAVYMKVLPKFNGSHARLHGPLTSLQEWANNPARVVSVPIKGDAANDGESGDGSVVSPLSAHRLDRVATRAERMRALLEANGFVAFG